MMINDTNAPATRYPHFENGATLKTSSYSCLPLERNEIRIYKASGNWDIYSYDHETMLIGSYLRTEWMG